MNPVKSTFTALCFLAIAQSSHAGLYWFAGVRSNTISVCFVGDALTSRPARVQQIRDYISHFQNIANILFTDLGTCAAAVTHPSDRNKDYFAGDIRVVIPGVSIKHTGQVPGKGCPMFLDDKGNYNGENDGGGSWSNSPQDLASNRSCQFNLKLGDDGDSSGTPWLSHTLHEFGHALGLSHEHVRADIPGTCVPTGDVTDGYITQYDPASVMHYKFAACGIDGNYSQVGLSNLDRLTLHIMYPESGRYAEHSGTRVIRAGTALKMQALWALMGANPSFVYNSISWSVDGSTVSYGTSLNYQMNFAGTYTVKLTYKDFLGRTYNSTVPIEVLSASNFSKRNASISAAAALVLL